MNNAEAEAVAVAALIAGNWFNEFFLEDEDDEQDWEKITVDVEEYRRMGDPCFRWHFRLTKPVFEDLLLVITNHLVEENRLIRERTPMSHILLAVLWILATPDTFRSVALRFGMYPSAVYGHYQCVIEALRELGPRFIAWPDQHERSRIKEYCENRSGFPGIVGIMDGSHIFITAPVHQKAAYRNYKHGYSIKAQVVCDHRLLVRDLYVGEAGSLHDARVFRRSPLFRNLITRNDMLGEGEHIIADSAYMLMDKVLIPFDNDGHLQPLQKNYNRILSRVRAKVEHTFGHAQALWRRIHYFPCRNLENAVDHIVAVFVLHNFRILHGEEIHVEYAHQNFEDEEDEIILVNGHRRQQEINDRVPDPHVPQGDIVNLINIARARGDQKRWDICNLLPAWAD